MKNSILIRPFELDYSLSIALLYPWKGCMEREREREREREKSERERVSKEVFCTKDNRVWYVLSYLMKGVKA